MDEIGVLLVESDIGDARFIQDALSEIGDTPHDGAWLNCRVQHCECGNDAVLVLEQKRPEVVLFSPGLAGNSEMRALKAAAPSVPLIALLNAGDEPLGRRLLRQGAQDYVLKSEIDCGALARAMLNAIERERFLTAVERTSVIDTETGLYNTIGFHALAARDLALANDCGRTVSLVLAEIDNLPEIERVHGAEAAHDVVVAAADVLRAGSGTLTLAARIGPARLALLDWTDETQPTLAWLESETQSEHNEFAWRFGFASTADFRAGNCGIQELMTAAEKTLYDNKQTCSNLP